ncbi:hypothetical protein EJB05_06955, partial [Eragrostis curvula]
MGNEDDDDEEYVADEEEEEEDFAEELPASSAGEEGEDSDAEYQEDEEEEEEEETPRPVKASARSRKRKMDPATARARKRRYEEDDDYEEEPDDDEEYHEEIEEEEEEEEEEATPRPKSAAKCARRGHKAEVARSNRKSSEDDTDFEPELDDDDEEEEEEEVNEDIDFDTEVVRSDRQKFEENEEEEEEGSPRPKGVAKSPRRGNNAELARSNRRKTDEDMDFEPELDDDEEDVDEDIDFDPDVDDDDEDEFEDEDEAEFSARSRKVANPVKRKSVSKRRSLKKKKAKKGSKDSKRKRKTGSRKSKKSAPIRRPRKRFVVGDSEDDSEDDDDFIVEDEVEVNRPPRKKARTGTNKRTELDRPAVGEEETWPTLDSDTSEFEFVTSDEDRDDGGTTVVEASTVRKGRKRRKFGSESSSDSEFIVSDKELENLGEPEAPKVLPVLSTPIRKISITTRHVEDKGKKKEELEEAGIPICGICLSEEQRATVQGVLNCCSHYFCFACIMEWSRVESRCPLCKQRFTTITKSSKEDLGLGQRKAIIKVEERDQVYQPTEEEIRRWLDPYENVVCIECNQGGDDSLMLLCDICDSSAHTYCVGLGREVPEGNWYCGGCRLGDEGPSHARVPHTVGFERQSYRNVDFSSVGFGVAAQNGTYDRSSSINRRRSIQGIDLNLSPREVPGEIHPAESQVSTDSVSTPSGTRATVSGRRQIHRYIRILLSRPRSIPTTRVEDMPPNFGHRNGVVPRTDLNHRSFRPSSEANTSQILPDGFQSQYNALPFAPSPLDGDDFQHIEGVKSNLRNAQ